MTTTATATPAKLRDGSWGARVQGTVERGDRVTITTKAGKSWEAIVSRVVWSGQGVAIVATESADRSTRSGASRGRRTGCACGSREDESGELIWSERNCRSCNFDAYDN